MKMRGEAGFGTGHRLYDSNINSINPPSNSLGFPKELQKRMNYLRYRVQTNCELRCQEHG